MRMVNGAELATHVASNRRSQHSSCCSNCCAGEKGQQQLMCWHGYVCSLCVCVLQDICPGSDEVIIVTSSLMKDMNSKVELYRYSLCWCMVHPWGDR